MVSHLSRRARLALLAGVAALGLALLAAACGGGGDEETNETPTGNATAAGGGPVTLTWTMGDNFFQADAEKNPTLEVSAGASVTINLENKGTAIHNMRFAGDDNKYNTSDDAASEPALFNAGDKGVIKFTAPAKPGTYDYQCDFHPTDMKGKIVVK